MIGNFDKCFAITRAREGWRKFSNHPKDPGGATYSGITQRVWDAYCDRKRLPRSDVRAMRDEQAAEIYREQYWRAVRADELPAGVDLLTFDICVNSGPARAVKILQGACGAVVDGHLGIGTLAAVKGADPFAVIRAMDAARLAFWRRLPTWLTFGKGWTAREAEMLTRALVMARPPLAPSAPPPLSATPGRGFFARIFGS